MNFATGAGYLKDNILPHMWCSGCGHGIVLGALVRSFEELNYKKNEIVVVTGIGCWGKADDYLVTNALHTTHGRALSFATGVKTFNPRLKVVVLMGDGDGATIGGNHLIHAARRNIDLTAIIVNNFNYGMTGGQCSGTTPADSITSTTAYGNPERELDICALAGVAGANYVARSTVYHGWELKKHLKEALGKEGFSLLEVVSPCPTQFGRNNKMKQPALMLNWLKDKAVPVEKFNQMDNPQGDGFFAIGKLTDRDAPGFIARYEAVKERARGL